MFQKYAFASFIFCEAIFVGFLLFSPSLSYKVGNTFFGSVPSLYNVTIAQSLFAHAAYPILGKPAPYAHYQLSRTYFIQGKLNAALSEAKKELEFFPDHWRTHYILGLTLGYMDREEEAIEAFGTFIGYKPDSWAARNDKAWLQFRIGDFAGALATIEPVAHDTGNPWVQNTYGTLLLNKGKIVEAKQAFQYAKNTVESMTEASWGRAYPGNDPRVYGIGLSAMMHSIEGNLQLAESAPAT